MDVRTIGHLVYTAYPQIAMNTLQIRRINHYQLPYQYASLYHIGDDNSFGSSSTPFVAQTNTNHGATSRPWHSNIRFSRGRNFVHRLSICWWNLTRCTLILNALANEYVHCYHRRDTCTIACGGVPCDWTIRKVVPEICMVITPLWNRAPRG